MDKKIQVKLNQILGEYQVLEKRFSKKFNKLPTRYFWIFGAVSSIMFTIVFMPNFLVFPPESSDTDRIVVFTFFSLIMALLFTGFAIMIVGFGIFLAIITPILQNKIKEIKTIFVDYPKLLREGTFNENTEGVVKEYLRIVFREELETIRENLKAEVMKEVKKIVNPANAGFQKHETQINDLKEKDEIIKKLLTKKTQSENNKENTKHLTKSNKVEFLD